MKKKPFLLLPFLLLSCSAPNTNNENNESFGFSIKSTNGFVENSSSDIVFYGDWNTENNASHSGGSVARSLSIDDNTMNFKPNWTTINHDKFTGGDAKRINGGDNNTVLDDSFSTDPELKFSNDIWNTVGSHSALPGKLITEKYFYDSPRFTYNGSGWTTSTFNSLTGMTNSGIGNSISFSIPGNHFDISVLRAPDRGKIIVKVFDGATLVTQINKDLKTVSETYYDFIPVSLDTFKTYNVVIEPDPTNSPSDKYDLQRVIQHPDNVKIVRNSDPGIVYTQNGTPVSYDTIKSTSQPEFRLTNSSQSWDPNISSLDGQNTNSSIEIPFYGTNIYVKLIKSSNRGIVNFKVYDEGNNLERDVTEDLYNSSFSYDHIKIHSLKMGNHKLIITPTGTKNALSTGYRFDFTKANIYPSFEYSFYGTSITYSAVKDSQGGKVRVSLDNNPNTAQTIDISNPTTVTADIFTTNALSKEPHKITVEATEEPGATDRQKISLKRIKGFPYVKGNFTGDEVKVLTVKRPNHGKADLYIDNVFNQTIDLYNPASGFLVYPLTVSGLSSGSHSFTLVGLDDKNASSTDTVIAIDSLINSKARYTFTSDKISYYASKNSDLGMVDIYIDGVFQQRADLFSVSPAFNQLIFSKQNLGFVEHTIEVKPAGMKNASSDGFSISVDAFDSRTNTVSGGVGGD